MRDIGYSPKTADNHKALAKYIANIKENKDHNEKSLINLLASLLSDVYNDGYDQAIKDLGRLR